MRKELVLPHQFSMLVSALLQLLHHKGKENNVLLKQSLKTAEIHHLITISSVRIED